MIRVYNSTERDFRKNGLQVLDRLIIDPVVSETINGLYQLEFSIPILSSDHIEKENIIVAPTPTLDDQAFRISQIRKTNGMYHVTCYHIFYDLTHNMIEDINIVNAGASSALNKIDKGCIDQHPFRFFTDISNKLANCRLVRYNPVRALLGNDENTFISRWGGEIERNNFNITMKKRLGIDSSVKILYRKNLIGYEADIDYTQITTKIMPKASDGLLLPEKYIESPKINSYHTIKTKVIEYSDIKVRDENSSDSEGMSIEEAHSEMRRRAWAEFSENHIDEPRANYKVNFIDLEMTKEFKHLKKLESVNLGDRLKVIHREENLDVTARVISYKYNPVSRRYIEIELGNVVDKFTSITSELKRINDKIDTEVMSAVDDSKKAATKLIKEGFGGHVKIMPDKILIMDTDDVDTAKKVWMWNKNGLGFSNTGVNGEFGLAMTLDGAIVADYITSGTLNANVIKAGKIKGKNFDLDLDSGLATFGENSITKNSLSQDLFNELKGKDGSDATIFDWLKEWNTTLTQINGKKVVTPSIYAGTQYSGIYLDERGLFAKNAAETTVQIKTDGSAVFGSNTDRQIKVDIYGNLTTPRIYTSEIKGDGRLHLDANGSAYIQMIGDDLKIKNSSADITLSSDGIEIIQGSRVLKGGTGYAGLQVAYGTIMEMDNSSSNMNIRGDYGFWATQNGTQVLSANTSGTYGFGYHNMSDSKTKENIKIFNGGLGVLRKNENKEITNLSKSEILEFIKNIKFYLYNFKHSDKTHLSIMTQDISGNVRDILVNRDEKTGYFGIDLYNYISMLHIAFREEIKKREVLESKVASLDSDIGNLRKELEALKSMLPAK
ncbi:MAG: phage tail protein [Peptostreptococcus stomatis]|uniref:phage tail spike protein n=1 Tax=Peptostreptococcus stomatis TaxID=341694 RepID=UPI001A5C8B85|nr:phage tail spike protein [Peptostreptococcus stomatis]MBL6466217.1 phage tail protein [Peptostreptococcus stomatis]